MSTKFSDCLEWTFSALLRLPFKLGALQAVVAKKLRLRQPGKTRLGALPRGRAGVKTGLENGCMVVSCGIKRYDCTRTG